MSDQNTRGPAPHRADGATATDPRPRYASAREHQRDELALVQMFLDRAMARGRARNGFVDDAVGPGHEALVDAFHRIEDRVARTREFYALPMDVLRLRFGLTLTEQRVLWTLVGFELDPQLRRSIRQIATEPTSGVTIGTLMTIVYEDESPASLVELGLDSRLFQHCLVELDLTDVGVPVSQRRVRVADRVLELATGVVRLDPVVARFARVEPPSTMLADLEVGGRALERLAATGEPNGDQTIVAWGRSGSGRRSVLTSYAASRGLDVLTIDTRELALQRDAVQRQLQLVTRECRLLGAVPLFCHLDSLVASGDLPDRLDLIGKGSEGLVLGTCIRPIARQWKRPTIFVELPPISSAQREKLWACALSTASARDAEYLATTYPLAPALIHAVGVVATREWGGTGQMSAENFATGIRAVLDDRLAGLATRLTITQEWNDLVLPDDQTFAMLELLARIRERRRVYEDWGLGGKVGKGLGVSALFSGPPGTGKSMAAGLLAHSLEVEIYQVDLSKIVSKWIGETEKNLAALFDAAEAGHAILLFDEADALFGKRTAVQSSNDRHANQEVNYLLQRLESFAGICILTTNHDAAIDEAFRRRLSCHVRFPLPDAEERERLWTKLLTGTAPVAEGIEFSGLARTFVMSGGYIRNAVLRAAFLAADAGTEITAEVLVRAAQLEYEAMGKIVTS